MYQEIEGDLIKLALEGKFDVIAHGCNCQATMGAGVALQMAKVFKADMYDKMIHEHHVNSYDSFHRAELLGNNHGFNPHSYYGLKEVPENLIVINCYTQYMYGTNHADGVSKPLDYEALTLCLRKMNHVFKGKHIGLPLIGCHLAGGDWNVVKQIIQKELKDMDVTIVHYKPS